MAEPPAARHDPAGQRFVARLGEDEAELRYRRQGRALDCYHTEVPPAFRGQGIAERLCDAAFDYAAAQGLSIMPSCPYISGAYLARHPERRGQIAGVG